MGDINIDDLIQRIHNLNRNDFELVREAVEHKMMEIEQEDENELVYALYNQHINEDPMIMFLAKITTESLESSSVNSIPLSNTSTATHENILITAFHRNILRSQNTAIKLVCGRYTFIGLVTCVNNELRIHTFNFYTRSVSEQYSSSPSNWRKERYQETTQSNNLPKSKLMYLIVSKNGNELITYTINQLNYLINNTN